MSRSSEDGDVNGLCGLRGHRAEVSEDIILRELLSWIMRFRMVCRHVEY